MVGFEATFLTVAFFTIATLLPICFGCGSKFFCLSSTLITPRSVVWFAFFIIIYRHWSHTATTERSFAMFHTGIYFYEPFSLPFGHLRTACISGNLNKYWYQIHHNRCRILIKILYEEKDYGFSISRCRSYRNQ